MERDLDDAALRTGPADAPYWHALSQGQLIMQKCQGCDRWTWPAVSRCGECGTWEPEWQEIALEGKLFSWTRTWHPFGGTEGIGTPFVTVLASLPHAGGKRLLGLYEGDESMLALDLPLKGRIATTRFGEQDIPAIRWLPA